MQEEWNDVEVGDNDLEDAMNYVREWVKGGNGQRGVTMLAQIMIVLAMRCDSVSAGSILRDSIDQLVNAEAN